MMKKLLIGMVLFCSLLYSDSFDTYLKSFDYEARQDMKIKTVEMLNMIEDGTAQVIDIRFPEEYEAWHIGFAKNIPLNELPNRLDELDKTKLIITACPHNDRANIARMYLMLKGYKVRYLSDGLLTVTDYLRGENAKEFMEEYKKGKTK
jgi:rhodanese-related sulfurtransferase